MTTIKTSITTTTTSTSITTSTIFVPKSNTFSLSEISRHNSAGDCWLIISNRVYDVTNYLNFHPEGPETIIPYCGEDATTAFETKDKNKPKPHSPDANNLLSYFYIGDVD